MARKWCSSTQSYSHMNGCGCGPPWEPSPSKGMRREAAIPVGTKVPKAPKGHAHNYQAVGKPFTDSDKEYNYLKQRKHCDRPGCNQPDYVETLAAILKTKEHEHVWSPVPSRTWWKGKRGYALYECTVKGCSETRTDHT